VTKRLRQEEGIALLMALGFTIVLTIFVVSMITFTSASQRNSRLSSGDLQARQYAEAGLNTAYSILVNQNTVSGGNPAAANLLGCNGASGATDTNGPSNCATPSAKIICVAAASGCTAQSVGSVSVFGFFSGPNPATYQGVTVPASTWLLVSTGYSRNPNTGSVDAKVTTAQVKIEPLDSGAVASVWNHMFITSPLIPNQCSVDFGGNNENITDPIYVIGNLCLSGQNVAIQTPATGGQPVDLQVGGKLVLSGSGSKVGTDSTHPIYSGVVVGGCTTVSVSSTTTPCSPSSFNYWVGQTDTFVPNDAPEKTSTEQANDYANFDPGPMHTCKSGTTPAPLADAVFDNNIAGSGEPNNSGSSTPGGTFELVPNFSYACISKTGSNYMIWNNSTSSITVANVPAAGQNLTVPGKTLAVNASNPGIFIDGNMTISQSATYTGTAVLEVAGTVTFNGNATALCATGPPCDFNNWQGSSTNKSMLNLVPLASNTTAITFTNNTQTFQGSLWCQPSSSMTFVKNGVTIEGPISIGKFDNTFNNAVFKPLPVIKNMPVGAPLPPNTSAAIDPLVITK
jgi:Tfp pilus assembly protein PilX